VTESEYLACQHVHDPDCPRGRTSYFQSRWLARVKLDDWEQRLETTEVEARSILVFSLVIGHHFMAADHGAHSHTDVLELAVKRLLA